MGSDRSDKSKFFPQQREKLKASLAEDIYSL